MTIRDGKYPNQVDLEPKLKIGKGVVPTYELPLADPAFSNWTKEFQKNAFLWEKDPFSFETSQSIIFTRSYEQNDLKQTSTLLSFNERAHAKWNEHKARNK